MFFLNEEKETEERYYSLKDTIRSSSALSKL